MSVALWSATIYNLVYVLGQGLMYQASAIASYDIYDRNN